MSIFQVAWVCVLLLQDRHGNRSIVCRFNCVEVALQSVGILLRGICCILYETTGLLFDMSLKLHQGKFSELVWPPEGWLAVLSQ